MTYDIETDGRTLVFWLSAAAAATVASIAAYVYAIAHPDVLYVSDFAFGLVDGVEIFSLLVFLPTAFLTLRWIYRANSNAQGLANGMSMSPGWNIGWFFVPIAHLWKPFVGMRETWAISTDPARWTSISIPARLWAWWICWAVSDVLGWISLALSWDKYATAVVPYLPLDIAAYAAQLLAILLLIASVRALSRRQALSLTRSAFA